MGLVREEAGAAGAGARTAQRSAAQRSQAERCGTLRNACRRAK